MGEKKKRWGHERIPVKYYIVFGRNYIIIVKNNKIYASEKIHDSIKSHRISYI